MGRTGSFFAFEQLGVRPQLVTLAKALANGLPIGCLLVADEAAGAFEPGDHGSTFGGNPVVCAAAVAVCDAIDDELLAAGARERRTACRPASRRCPAWWTCAAPACSSAPSSTRPAQPVVDAALDAGLVCLVVRPERPASRAAARRERRRRRSRARDPRGGDWRDESRTNVTPRSCGSSTSGRSARRPELAEALRSEGHDVVQTTVSRDIHELGLIKMRHASGRLVYAPPRAAEARLERGALRRARALGARDRAEREPRRRDDAARLCERARRGDRRRAPSAHRRDDRRREHRAARRRASR